MMISVPCNGVETLPSSFLACEDSFLKNILVRKNQSLKEYLRYLILRTISKPDAKIII
jgi:hypothetical protein